MSDTMLHGVLNMPPEIWADSMIDKMQRHGCYVQASKRIEDLNKALVAMTNAHSNWAMNVSYSDEELIAQMLLEAER